MKHVFLAVLLVLFACPAGARSPAEDGFRDRSNFEAWIAGLAGAQREGALWWAMHHDESPMPSCIGPNVPRNPYWLSGCIESAQALAPSNARLLAEPEYRRGWNSWEPSSPSRSPALPQADAPSQRELQALNQKLVDGLAAALAGRLAYPPGLIVTDGSAHDRRSLVSQGFAPVTVSGFSNGGVEIVRGALVCDNYRAVFDLFRSYASIGQARFLATLQPNWRQLYRKPPEFPEPELYGCMMLPVKMMAMAKFAPSGIMTVEFSMNKITFRGISLPVLWQIDR